MLGSTWATITQNGSTSKSIEILQCTVIGEDLWLEVSSYSSLLSKDQRAEQMKHWGDEIHIKMDETCLLRWGFVDPMLPLLKANHLKFVQCCLEFLTFKVGLGCHATFPKHPNRCLMTDSSILEGCHVIGIQGEYPVHVSYEHKQMWEPSIRQHAQEGLVRVQNNHCEVLNVDAVCFPRSKGCW